jgi:hypothetical protein
MSMLVLNVVYVLYPAPSEICWKLIEIFLLIFHFQVCVFRIISQILYFNSAELKNRAYSG